MNTLSAITEPLGWALMHFLWQGAVIAVALRLFLWLARRRSPQLRYAAAGVALLLMLGAAAGTVWWQVQAAHTETAAAAAPAHGTDLAYTPHLPYEPQAMGEPAAAPLPTDVAVESQASAAPPAPPVVQVAAEKPTTTDRLRPFLPWLVGVWAAGVLVFSLRLFTGWRVVRRWRAAASSVIPGDWTQRFAGLCERLGITCSVRLLSSATLAVPVVIGWLKPVVLVPASLFAGIPSAQLEALLVHELAHVRRHDYLVNLLQSALETLFFYHPAVWWVSGQLRNEREHCCDDVATDLAGGVLDYARALTALEEMRSLPVGLSLSAAGGSLLQRIRRLAGASEPRTTSLAWPLGLITLAAVAAALPLTLLHAAPDGSSPAEKPGAVGAGDAKDSGNPAGVPAVLTDELERLLKVTSDLAKFETELDISVPAADPANAKSDGRPGELVINVQEDGNVVFNGKTLTAEQLAVELAEVAQVDKKRAIIIRGTEATSYNKIVAVLAATHKAGLHHVSFATTTKPPPGGDKKATEEKDALSNAEKIGSPQDEKRRRIIIPRSAQDDTAGEKPPGNYSRIFQHKDGTRTESLRTDSTLRESTYDRNGVRVGARVFIFDKDGQPRQAVIYDGKMNPLGSIHFGYDPKTGVLVEERHFNAKAQMVRRVFYPGALKQPEYAGKFVAFTYDPENPTAKPVVESGDVKPALPVSDWKEAKTLNFRRSKFEEGDGEIRELTYGRDDQLRSVSVAYLDELGRHRLAVVCDGKMNPEQSILYSYHGATRQLTAERHFDRNGKLIHEESEAELKQQNGRARFIGEVLPFPSSLASPPVKTDAGARKVENAAEAQRLTGLGKGFFDAQQFEKAQESYEAAVIMDPVNAEVRRKWLLSEAMLARQSNPFAVPTHPEVRKEALATSLSLTVKDADGSKVIPAFRVIAGIRSQAGNKDIVNWQPHTLGVGTNGWMLWPLDKAYDVMALRVEADGYLPQVSNWIEKQKGLQELVFQMVEDRGTHAKILTPDGLPASGATVALAMVQRDAVMEGGKLRHDGEALPESAADRWRWPRLIEVDAGGGFMLPAEDDPTAAVLVVHFSGVREMSFAEFKKLPVVTLQPWARIEGRVQWGDKPGAGAAVSLTIHRDSYGYPGIVAQYEKTTAGTDGSFVFEKVLPGHVQLSCPIEAEPGNKSGVTQINITGRIAHLEVKPGRNKAVIGGAGRVVKGKLTGRDSWEGVTFHFHPTAPHVGFSGDDEMWKAWGEFQKSPSGPLFFRDGLKVKADGAFEIAGVLPGSYQIFFSLEGGKDHVASGKFDVGAEVPGQQAEPLDAGEFTAK